MPAAKIAVAGAGAAATAVVRMLLADGAGEVVVWDRFGVLHRERREAMEPMLSWLAEHTNPNGVQTIEAAVDRADVFIGLSAAGALLVPLLDRMAKDAIVFAMANPTPEIMPESARAAPALWPPAAPTTPTRSTTSSVFPGCSAGCSTAGAKRINEAMKRAAAEAIAAVIAPEELHEDYIIPSVFNWRVVARVARAVAEAAHQTGVRGGNGAGRGGASQKRARMRWATRVLRETGKAFRAGLEQYPSGRRCPGLPSPARSEFNDHAHANEIHRFHEDGFCLVEDFLDEDDLAPVIAALEEAVADGAGR